MQTRRSISLLHTAARILHCENVSNLRLTVVASALLVLSTGAALAQNHDNGVDDAFLPSPSRTVSTVRGNGDVNPYGVVFIKDNFQTGSGPLHHGDVLVSNFNNKQNLQGTGTTIVRIPKTGLPSTFFQGQPG